jgi:two-component system nitrate/nitrite response regulator NarL
MQGMDGLQTLTKLRDRGITSRIVMLTVSDADDDVLTAIGQGADGYLLKDTDPDMLLEQIKQAVGGKMVLSEAVTKVLAAAIRRPAVRPASELDALTGREVEILECIAKGMSNKVIARELDISDGTVKVHVKHLLKKLGLRSRVEAAVWMVNQQGEDKG